MIIGMVMSGKQATLDELSTIYDIEEAYNMLEVIMVDAHNINVARKPT